MSTEVESILNELSIGMLMGGATEDTLPLLDKLAVAAQEGGFADLVSSLEYVRKERAALAPAAWQTLLGKLLSEAAVYVKNPKNAKLPGPSTAVETSTEMSGAVDPQFLIEFIEKHTGLCDELESAIVDLRYKLAADLSEPDKAEAVGDFESYAKGYIHNMKGDAGSIGLMGIEKTCHFVEDEIAEKGARYLLDALLAFKEWVGACMRAFSNQEIPAETAPDFAARFSQLSANAPKREASGDGKAPEGGAAGAEPQAKDATAQKQEVAASLGEDLPPEANLDLLAELLSEGIGVKPQEAPAAAPKPAGEAAAAPAPAAAGAPEYEITGDREVFSEFCAEAEDHLNIIESLLLEAKEQYSKDDIDCIFRGIHSIKGASSYFGLKEITESSHKTETLLDEVRDGKRALDQGLADLVLSYVDLQHRLINNAKEAVKGAGRIQPIHQTDEYLAKLSALKGDPVKAEPAGASPAPAAPSVEGLRATAKKALELAKKSESPEDGASSKSDKLEVKNFVKIDTQRLDLLIDSIGEMCIYSSMLVNTCRELLGEDERILKNTHQVEKFSRDLQNIGMSMRLIPIRGLFQKMSRLVWDTGKKIGKDIKFQMQGEDTELDRSIIDKLADPLMHMVRNALDHGVETPADRVAAGKSPSGTIKLSAAHAGGSIHIRVEDDGRGLDPDKLLKKALEKGLIGPNQNLTREEIYGLIFAAGFSTAAVVTDISGRGVGMDVVKRNIESMRDRVHIDSEVGKGTSFLIELPLTLAIIDGIRVGVGPQSYVIPTLAVVEFMRPEAKKLMRTLDRGETYEFRGRFLPVYRLAELFSVEPRFKRPEDSTFVIVESGGELVALMVDEILGTYSTVIKSLGDMFEQGQGVAGCAILPNGDVALIVDVRSLVQVARAHYDFPQVRAAKAETEAALA